MTLFTRTYRGWALVIPTRYGECLLDLPPKGITEELVRDTWMGEAWVRFLTCWPIAVYDAACNLYRWPFDPEYWRISARWLSYPLARLFRWLGIWEVEPGCYFWSGHFRWPVGGLPPEGEPR